MNGNDLFQALSRWFVAIPLFRTDGLSGRLATVVGAISTVVLRAVPCHVFVGLSSELGDR